LALFLLSPGKRSAKTTNKSVLEILLASHSPRRRELIQLLGCPVSFIVAHVDESSVTNEDPKENVTETARLKAAFIANRMTVDPGSRSPLIVAADTTVSLDGRMLGKPTDETEAWSMLQALRGRTHEVHTGITLLDLATGREVSSAHTAVVKMRAYSDEEIAAYVATGDPMDKAGAYAIQHPSFQPVEELDGCFTGVMGLSVCHLLMTLKVLDKDAAVDMAALFASHQGFRCHLYEELATTR
jgi:septum formation protein